MRHARWRNDLILLAIFVGYWLTFFSVFAEMPLPVAWNFIMLFVFGGTPLAILVACAVQFSRRRPFTWGGVAGFSFAMILVGVFVIHRLGTGIVGGGR